MPIVDFESLTKPVSAEAPCGPDLELAGDADYMNFLAGAEGLLPKSFFGKDQAGNEGRPFDRNSIDFAAQFEAATPFLKQTRDLRMLGILAKFCILNRDFSGFLDCIRAISALLAEHWDDVHPRAEDGDYGFRMVAVEAIEALPTVILPLQFMPLIEHKRFGTVSLRSYLMAKGEVAPTEGESPIDMAAVEKVLREAELPTLIERRQQIMELEAALKQIRTVWMDKCSSGPSVALDRLPAIAGQIFGMLDTAIVKRDPSAAVAGAEGAAREGAGDGKDSAAAEVAVSVGQVTSSAHAGRVLAAVAAYFSRSEPSNPALLLVRQAQDLLGKSFLEVIQLLVPDHLSKAAINIGKEQSFELPIERLAAAASTQGQAVSEPSVDGPAVPDVEVGSRIEALALLDQVGHYFRMAEPSSPIPFLTDRARDLAQRDFLSVLKALLPADTLKSN
jgi:type VI secretion system protein ImpA